MHQIVSNLQFSTFWGGYNTAKKLNTVKFGYKELLGTVEIIFVFTGVCNNQKITN
jgi:hypothetical protein